MLKKCDDKKDPPDDVHQLEDETGHQVIDLLRAAQSTLEDARDPHDEYFSHQNNEQSGYHGYKKGDRTKLGPTVDSCHELPEK
ncbi:hypothetical protein SDC9_81786 [bioreactor metagenome]|uniref:Uncharacterized protein n=1 Tax=bioreactor metagenome TaxID=1076179 RepID=A0A644Z2W1_9ZZZZ